jgi:hypothetical protein
MPLSLQQTQAANELAAILADFLPGKPHPYADPTISFYGIAAQLGLGAHWSGGSKGPAITRLLLGTLEHRRDRFCTLVLNVVRRGLTYRMAKSPVMREEIEAINTALRDLGFKVKDLNDPGWLGSLPTQEPVAGAERGDSLPGPPVSDEQLATFRRQLAALDEEAPVRRGFRFERFLNELFEATGLAPRNSFRLTGDQIDGSFALNGHTYLVEAKWQGPRLGQEQLLVFSGKVGGKAVWARGALISMSGYTPEGLEAFARGKQTNIICVDGLDLHDVLAGGVALPRALDAKQRRAVESTEAFVPVRTLFPALS